MGIPVPVIGARTAGLSFIDPSIEICEQSLQLKFSARQHSDVAVHEAKEEISPQKRLFSAQRPFMRSEPMQPKESAMVGTLQHDIAVMDAQIANLSHICNDIESNYYDLNSKMDESHDFEQQITRNANQLLGHRQMEQIGTIQAQALLLDIQQNLNAIDGEMENMDASSSQHRKSKLRNLKKKRSSRRKEEQMIENLEQQTDRLNAIYDSLS